MFSLSDFASALSNTAHRYVGGQGDCWIWHGYKVHGGYGAISLGDKQNKSYKQKMLHRISYCLFNDIDFDDIANFVIMHNCDTPSCFNPLHLRAGTLKDNVQDMVNKGRQCIGESQPSAKLTEGAVREIRNLLEQGLSSRKIARLYNVSQTLILYIKHKSIWKHVL